MPNEHKRSLVNDLAARFGDLRRLPRSNSLFVIGADDARIYLRYSRVHGRGEAFFGLRQVDLAELDGHNSFICFFTDDGAPPLFVPHADFERVIRESPLAADGQFKAQVVAERGSRELYLPHVGRFNVEGYGGLDVLAQRITLRRAPAPSLSHAQVQTLLGAIGHATGFGVYVPPDNAGALDWSLTPRFHVIERLPPEVGTRSAFTHEVDVIWLEQSRAGASALFEVEHSTPVYTGLLRFNDVLLTCSAAPRFFIVSNEGRRDLFSRQVQRPTFQRSGLSEITSFLEYSNVFWWHRRLLGAPEPPPPAGRPPHGGPVGGGERAPRAYNSEEVGQEPRQGSQ